MDTNARLDGFMVHPLDLFPSNKYLNNVNKISTNTATLDGFKVHPIDLFVSNEHQNINYNFNNNLNNNIVSNYDVINNKVNNNNIEIFPSGQVFNSGNISNNYQSPTNIEAYNSQIQYPIYNNEINAPNSFTKTLNTNPYHDNNILNTNNIYNTNNNTTVNNRMTYTPYVSVNHSSNTKYTEPNQKNLNNINYTNNISYPPKIINPVNSVNTIQLPAKIIHNVSEYESYIPDNNFYNNVIKYEEPFNQNITVNTNKNTIQQINTELIDQNYLNNNLSLQQNNISNIINNGLEYNPITNSNLITTINYTNPQPQFQPQIQPQTEIQQYYLPNQNPNLVSADILTKNINQYQQTNLFDGNLNNTNNTQVNLSPLNNVEDLTIINQNRDITTYNKLKSNRNLIKDIPYSTSTYEPETSFGEYQTNTTLNRQNSYFNLQPMDSLANSSLYKRAYTAPKLFNNISIIPTKNRIIVPAKTTLLIPENKFSFIPNINNNILTSTLRIPTTNQFVQPIFSRKIINRKRNTFLPLLINTNNYNTQTITSMPRAISHKMYNSILRDKGKYFNTENKNNSYESNLWPTSTIPLTYTRNTFSQTLRKPNNILNVGRLIYKPRNYNNNYFK